MTEQHTPWKVGRDMFGAVHVYDSGGDRLTNDRMCGTEGWAEKAEMIASAPDLLAQREALAEALRQIADETETPGPGHKYTVKGRIECANIARAALATLEDGE